LSACMWIILVPGTPIRTHPRILTGAAAGGAPTRRSTTSSTTSEGRPGTPGHMIPHGWNAGERAEAGRIDLPRWTSRVCSAPRRGLRDLIRGVEWTCGSRTQRDGFGLPVTSPFSGVLTEGGAGD
jgi:hypothetical protein